MDLGCILVVVAVFVLLIARISLVGDDVSGTRRRSWWVPFWGPSFETGDEELVLCGG